MRSFLLLMLLLPAFSLHAQPNKNLGIIPAPASVVITNGVFDLSKTSAIVYKDTEGRNEAELLHHFLLRNFRLDIPVVNNLRNAGNNIISFLDAGYKGKNPEGYTLTIGASAITVSGKGAGLFYGLQSLMQIIDANPQGLPCALINDEPRYVYRGIMQDVGYHIFPVDFIKKQIDMMARYKMNTYHWHLTEDHGWRIEIKKYPKLTSVGAYRAQSPISNYNDDMSGLDNTPYGGFYTQAQVRDVVNYAIARHVTIIPEIELPGHSLAALAAYPELACGDNPGPFKVAENWGIYDDVYCAGKDHTFDFLEDVLSEVIALFPGKYIHIGGDESPKVRWEKCKYCQKRIKDNHLKNEHELQSYFIRRIEKFVNAKGRSIIGWDEILEGGLAPKATVMSWRGIKGGINAAKQGHDVVMASESHLYFDFIQGPRELEPIAIGVGYNPLSRVYAFNPTPAVLTAAQQKHVIGVEAPLWTEHMETTGKVEYMLYPRLFALAEIAWTPTERKDYVDFTENRLPKHLLLLDKTETVYRVPTPIGQKDTTLWGNKFTLALKTPVESAHIYYNMDGQEVRETDHVYNSPLHIFVPEGEMRQLKTMVIAPSGKRSIVTTTTFVNTPPLDAVRADTTSLKLGVKYFYMPGKFSITDGIDINKATKTGIADEPDLEKFDSEDDHAMVYKGYINIINDGVYTFAMPAVGSNVQIGDKQGVKNSTIYNPFDLETYQYQEKTVSYNLKKGLHPITITYIPSDAGNRVRIASKSGDYESLKGKIFIDR